MPFTTTTVVNDDLVAYVTLETNATLQLICSQNHQGVSHFNHGNYSDAIRWFTDAMLTLKPLVNDNDSEHNEGQVQCCASLLIIPSPESRSTPQPTSVDESQVANEANSMKSRMYVRPFDVVATTMQLDDADSAENVPVDEKLLFSKLAIVLIFNLAMTHHAMAVVMMAADSESNATVSSPRDSLLQACSLYILAFSIAQNEPCLGMIWPVMMSLFAKTIFNNLGHCYASLDDDQTAIRCFELLLSSMMVEQHDHIYKRSAEEDDTTNHVYNDTTLCFGDSILFLILKDHGFASAA